MSLHEIIRAWKDAEYRASLSEAERAQLPEHPAGLVALDDLALDGATGGADNTRGGVVLKQWQGC
jgi:mersacidin/lichenicidin family type 2 lantibiotic